MRADRLLAIMMKLQAEKSVTTQALADLFEVSRRTILRDIDALSIAGVPIYTQTGPGGGISLDENYRVSLTGLREAEVRALFLSDNSALLADIGLGEASRNMLPKLFSALPSLHQQAVEQLRQRVHIDPAAWNERDTSPFLDTLLEAVNEDRTIRVVYQRHDGTIVERQLEPYSLVAKAQVWYLIAHREGEFRSYRVSRFHDVHLLDAQFERQSDFDLVAFWQENTEEFFSSLLHYTFTLRIHTRQMHFIRWYALGNFDIIEPPDERGWFTARFEMETSEPALMLVFGLGTDAVILEPPELRETVRAQSEALVQHLST